MGGGRAKGLYYAAKGRGAKGRAQWDHRTSGGRGSIPALDAEQTPKRKRLAHVDELRQMLLRSDGRPYPAYRDLETGPYELASGIVLLVLHVQADPFAPPSSCALTVSRSLAGFPADCFSSHTRVVALRDMLARSFAEAARRAGADQRAASAGWGGAKGGDLVIDAPGQYVLERSSVTINAEEIEVRFSVGLPARGRSILGEWAASILCETLPALATRSLLYSSFASGAVQAHLNSVEDQVAARAQLAPRGLVAFVADGSILPRASGASAAPLQSPLAIPFSSPPSLRTTLVLPHGGEVSGMGIPRGVTLIVGGGFHGKSTLLQALQLGVYDKVPGDGRELAVSAPEAAKVRAEDGRSITRVDITPFIDNLPFGKSGADFSTADASGSTSQAASIVEALEAGATALLLDEDTCATNLMLRSSRMERLVKDEPIRPYISRVRSLWDDYGISTLLVVGGAGDYFDVADLVLQMREYRATDVTEEARAIVSAMPASLPSVPFARFGAWARRPTRLGIAPGTKVRCESDAIRFGDLPELDLRLVEQLVETSQVRAIADAMQLLEARATRSQATTLAQELDRLERLLDEDGLDALSPGGRRPGNLSRPRRLELAAAINRFRALGVDIQSVAEGSSFKET